MKPFPTDPIRQNNLLVAAFCDDLFDMVATGTNGTPKADRVAEIIRQTNPQVPPKGAGAVKAASGE